ncbi:TolC family protein [Delftia acidovorans]|uniref:TolC family protein n=1 Tax=Delftia acidovorans TaxID=80866 RepID=A0AAJ2R7G1_DELAC|nr:TolC family protein [Delftia acidovorans]MDX4956542.1 TolC family protein [Delftia acidovorans]
MRSRQLTAIALVALLSGCNALPDFRRPELPRPINGEFAWSTSAYNAATPSKADHEFWRRFNDHLLVELVRDDLHKNRDLHIAIANFDAANVLLGQTKFDRYPTATMSSTVGHQRLSIVEAIGNQRSNDVYILKVPVIWELDFFGRVRRCIETQRATVAPLADDLQTAQVVIVSELTSTYVGLRGAENRLKILRRNLVTQERTLRIVNDRVEAGRDGHFNLARAKSELGIDRAREPVFQAQITLERNRIAVLTGHVPADIDSRLRVSGNRLIIPRVENMGLPADVLRRRPDVRAAEQRLHAATARVGVATADFFPKLSLGAPLGTYSFTSAALFISRAEFNAVVLGIDWSFLDVSRVRSRIEAKDADARGLLAQYQGTVLKAMEDTENSLERVARSNQELESLKSAADQAVLAESIGRRRFDRGAIGLFEYLDVQRSLLHAQDALEDGKTRSATAVIGLYAALAGGWPEQPPLRETMTNRVEAQQKGGKNSSHYTTKAYG